MMGLDEGARVGFIEYGIDVDERQPCGGYMGGLVPIAVFHCDNISMRTN